MVSCRGHFKQIRLLAQLTQVAKIRALTRATCVVQDFETRIGERKIMSLMISAFSFPFLKAMEVCQSKPKQSTEMQETAYPSNDGHLVKMRLVFSYFLVCSLVFHRKNIKTCVCDLEFAQVALHLRCTVGAAWRQSRQTNRDAAIAS